MEFIRRCIFKPYLKGQGPTFILTLWDINRRDHLGKNMLKYRLNMGRKTLFQGEDFACSPMDAIDSDACVNSIMGFLTLRPGDTDQDYFYNYTLEQREFCEQHAENLSYAVLDRLGEK